MCYRRPEVATTTVLKTLDRYVLREILPPSGLALLVFTFLLTIEPIMQYAEPLLARGVPVPTVARLILTLVPQALGIAIPVALLVGLLIAFGRLSGDREIVALLAGGVSLYRLVRPVALVSTAAAAATLWVMVIAIPDANQTFRELTYGIMAERVEHEVKPRVFFEDFPGKVLYVRDTSDATRGWRGVFVADTTEPGPWPTAYVAQRGYLVLDRTARRVDLVLEHGARHTPDDVLEFGSMTIALDPETVFPRTGPQRGIQEMTLEALREQIRLKQAQGLPVHNEIMAIHLKFSVPVACLVFGAIGLGLGVTSRKDGKLAGFVLGLAVVFLYYVVLFIAESLTKAQLLPAAWSRWVPNVVLGVAGVLLVVRRARRIESALSLRWPLWAGRLRRARPGGEAPGARTPRVVVVVRWPRVNVPAPTLLDRYVTRMHLRVMGLAFAGLLSLFYISTFIDLSDELFKGQASGWMLLQYFWYATPQFSYYVLPLSILIATLVTLGLLTKTSELTVTKACGISLYRTAAPLLVVGLVGAGVLFALEETVLAAANRRADAISRTIRGRPPRTVTAANRNWLAGRHGHIYHYRLFDPESDRLLSLSIFELDPSGSRLTRQTSVARAAFAGGAWVGQDGWTRRYQGPGSELEAETERFTERRLDLEPPEYFETERPSADMMTFGELRRHVAELELSGLNVARYRVDLQRKVAFPFVTVIMTLLAVPFAVTTGRRGALYGIGLGLALAMSYWFLTSLLAAVGTAGLLAPGLAAWAPNLLFAAGALYLLFTVST